MSESTTQVLLQAASDEFIERGYSAARIHEVARRAGLTTGAVYGRWPKKPELFAAALDYTFEQILPDRIIENTDTAGTTSLEILLGLTAALSTCHEQREVLIPAFGSARNDDAVRETLAHFVNEEADQLKRIVEQAKEAGLVDPEVPTAAWSLLCQAVALGTQMLLSAGLEEGNVPSEQDWNALLASLLGSTT